MLCKAAPSGYSNVHANINISCRPLQIHFHFIAEWSLFLRIRSTQFPETWYINHGAKSHCEVTRREVSYVLARRDNHQGYVWYLPLCWVSAQIQEGLIRAWQNTKMCQSLWYERNFLPRCQRVCVDVCVCVTTTDPTDTESLLTTMIPFLCLSADPVLMPWQWNKS